VKKYFQLTISQKLIGWVLGAIGDDESWIRRAIAATGCVVVDVGYRLAPEYRFPVPIEDSWAALEYVAGHREELGVDVSRISLGGWSAGGHISAVLSHRARDRGMKGIVFVLMAIPVTDAAALGTDLKVRPGASRVSPHCQTFIGILPFQIRRTNPGMNVTTPPSSPMLGCHGSTNTPCRCP